MYIISDMAMEYVAYMFMLARLLTFNLSLNFRCFQIPWRQLLK